MAAPIPGDDARSADDRTHDSTDDVADEVAEEVAELLHAVGRRLRHAARPLFEPLGVTPAQIRALRLIGRAGEPLRMVELAAGLRIAPRSATSVVDDLAQRGLVFRCADPADRRVVGVSITPEGQDLMQALGERRRAAGAQLVSSLSPTELAQLRHLLRRLDTD